jgi:hypothetical protein
MRVTKLIAVALLATACTAEAESDEEKLKRLQLASARAHAQFIMWRDAPESATKVDSVRAAQARDAAAQRELDEFMKGR